MTQTLKGIMLCVTALMGARHVDAQSIGESSRQTLQTWTVAPVPIFDTGKTGGDEDAMLLTVNGAARMSDGAMVVGDFGAHELKWFSPEGELVSRSGRKGSGPGDFELIDLIGSCGRDSAFVFDGVNQRLTIFGRDGRVVSTRVLFTDPSEATSPSSVECGRNDQLLVVGWPRGPRPRDNAAFRQQVSVRIQSIDGTEIVDAGSVPSGERQRFGRSTGPRPMGKQTEVAMGSDRIYIGTGDSLSILAVSMRGEQLAKVPLPFAVERISRSDVADFIDAIVSGNPNVSEARIRDEYGSIEYPREFPTHGEILVDADDQLWVERYRRPNQHASRWIIFSKAGKAIADIALPSRFRALEVGRDYILGSWTDADGVQQVRGYRLLRP